jgi:hypothetical protein
MYDICSRIKEVDPSLFIIVVDDKNSHSFIIMEHCSDGVDRLVWKVKELDQRVIDKALRLKAIPFEHRFAEAEKEEKRMEEEAKEEQFEELYERMGAPMIREFERAGFIQRNRSYPKGSKRAKLSLDG